MPKELPVLFRIDIAFDPERGYAAVVLDPQLQRHKGIRGNSIEQLLSRVRNVVLEEARKKTHFPLESERCTLITPDDAGFIAPP